VLASLATSVSVGDRPGCSPNPKTVATAAPTIAGSVTGTRSTYQAPRAYRPVTSLAIATANRVLPTPPGPTAVTSGCSATACASAARSAARPTNDVSGTGIATVLGASSASEAVIRGASSASARRSVTSSLRSSDEMWLSTARTEMTRRPAICAFVRWAPTSASTSASRSEMPASVGARDSVMSTIVRRGRSVVSPYRIRGGHGCGESAPDPRWRRPRTTTPTREIHTMTATHVPTRNGVDTARLFATLDAVKASPQIAKFQFRASNRWISGTHNESTIHGFYGAGQELMHRQPATFEADHPEVLVGEDNAPTPVEFLLHALAACLTSGIANIAAARGVNLTSVESTVEGDVDLLGILGLSDDVRNGYEQIRVSFHLEGDDPDKLRRVVEQSRLRSAVYDVLTNGVPVSIAVTTG